jgi:helicase
LDERIWRSSASYGIAPVPQYRRRCGRSGEFSEGDTIIFDNVLGSLRYTHPSVRQRWQLTLFADPPALRSAIANDNLPEDERKRIEAVVASQLLATIPEHPECENLDELLASTLYASFAGESEQTRPMLRRMRRELLDASSGEPFAVAASPMRLTDLGERANATGLSPGTCRILLQFTRADMAGESWQSICVALLLALAQCPEQQNGNLAAMAQDKQKRFFVGRTDLPTLIDGWVDQRPLHELFLGLPKAKASKAAVSPEKCVSGQGESDFVATQYDKFIDFVEHVLVGFLPWMLRSCDTFRVDGADWAKRVNWEGLARKLETPSATDLMSIDDAIRGGESDVD